MNELDLTKKLISIPSYVDSKNNEAELGKYLVELFKTIKSGEVVAEKVLGNRCNVILRSGKKVDLLVVGHIDTVQPRVGWKTESFQPVVKDDKLYGLGAADMKGSLATFITALKEVGVPKNFMLLTYVDEEYDFLGMKQFIKDYAGKIKPKFILSIDGGGPDIGYGCRGCIEIKFTVSGKSGHSARPEGGVNAIRISTEAVNKLEIALSKMTNRFARNTVNLAYLRGGLLLDNTLEEERLSREGNNIPDFCDFTVEVRSNSPKVNASFVTALVKKVITKSGGSVVSTEIRHDLAPWQSAKKSLGGLTRFTPESNFKSPWSSGYVDIAMLYNAFNKAPCATLGVGPTGNAHATNEWVSVAGLKRTKEIYKRILRSKG